MYVQDYPRLDRTFSSGSLLGLPATFTGHPYSLGATAVTAAEVVHVGKQAFLDLMSQQPDLCREATDLLSREVTFIQAALAERRRSKTLATRPATGDAKIFSSASFRSFQKVSTVEICTRSFGLCGSTIVGPNEIICIPGYFSPITPHSKPACMAISFAGFPNTCSCADCKLLHDLAVRLRLPSRIIPAVLRLEPGQREARRQLSRQRIAACLDRTPLAGDDLRHVAIHRYHREVGRVLHQPRNIRTHRHHPVRQRHQQVDDAFRVRRIQHLLRLIDFLRR